VAVGALETLTGEPLRQIHIVGGGSQNALLNQFTANACERPVTAGPVEATALGNLAVQIQTDGEAGSLAELRQIIRASSEVHQYNPEVGSQSAWKEAAENYAGLQARP
jgi:sugar (pentulose or hexulose) kinase